MINKTLLRKTSLVQALVLFLFSYSAQANYQWPKEIRSHAKAFKMDFKDGFVSTIVGSCHTPNVKYSKVKARVSDLTLRVPDSFNNEVTVKLGLLEDKDGNLKKAPVAFYIPGAFSNKNIKQTRRYLDFFTKKGYHTITFINPWGTDYLNSSPKHKIGHISKEGKSMFYLVLKAYRYLQNRDLVKGQSRLAGVSYGGFVTAMVSAYNAEYNNPLNLKDSTIISPPILLGKTINRIDDYIDDNRGFVKMNLLKILTRFKDICKAKSDDDISGYIRDNAEGIAVNNGFYDPFISSVRKYDKMNGLKKIPRVFWGLLSKTYRKWKYNYSFKKYFAQYGPELEDELSSEKGELYYWIKRAKAAGHDKSRVMLAVNDFLNDPQDIPNTKDIIVVPTGGHYGFRHLSWYSEFLDKAFK